MTVASQQRRPQNVAAALRAAVSFVLASPALWLLGAVGFLARGGLLLLSLPIWVVPSATEVTTLLGPDAVDPTGLATRMVTLVALAVMALIALVVAGLLAAAWADVTAYELFVRGTGAPVERGGDSGQVAAGRAALVARVAVVQGLLLIPAVLAAIATVLRLVEVARADFFAPGPLGVPYPVRLAVGAVPQLAAFVAAVVLAELAGAVMGRRAMRRVLGPAGPGPRGRSVAVTAVLAWAMSLGGWAILLIPVGVAWARIRAVYLTPVDPFAASPLAATAGTALFVAVWLAALLLAGVLSSVRCAFWNARWVGSREPAKAASGDHPGGHESEPEAAGPSATLARLDARVTLRGRVRSRPTRGG